MELSILTVSRSESNLNCLLESIANTVSHLMFEVLCSWNGDGEPPANLAAKFSFPIRFFYFKPYNFSKNNNDLAKQALGDALLFINDDVELDPGCVQKTFAYFKGNPNVGIVGANLRYLSDKIQHGGMYISRSKSPFHFLKGQAYYKDFRLLQTYNVPSVTGAYMLIKKNEFMRLQFDEKCLVAAQDVILCIRYRELFSKEIVYVGSATAVHKENETRKLFDQRTTPEQDVRIMMKTINDFYDSEDKQPEDDVIRLRIVTEKPGWIMYRKGYEIHKRLNNSVINEDYRDANVHYYINYGYFNRRPSHGLVVANFTHFDPDKLADKWVSVAHEVDHCVAVSEKSAEDLRRFGIPEDKITVIRVGADISFQPTLTLGLVGRVYSDGRKGEHLVKELLSDEELMMGVKIVAINDTWGVPVWKFDDMADFYRSIDYLLITATLEGGPVPFMEALACGTLAIAPPIGVIPEFPHIEYKVGDIKSLKLAVESCKKHYLDNKFMISRYMQNYNWATWARQHIELFKRLLMQ